MAGYHIASDQTTAWFHRCRTLRTSDLGVEVFDTDTVACYSVFEQGLVLDILAAATAAIVTGAALLAIAADVHIFQLATDVAEIIEPQMSYLDSNCGGRRFTDVPVLFKPPHFLLIGAS